MIIDLILDRKDNERYTPREVTYSEFIEWKNSEEGKQMFEVAKRKGETYAEPYNPKKFYNEVMGYDKIFGTNISEVMDYGEEDDVKQALCNYIISNDYNPEICDYISSVNWLTEG